MRGRPSERRGASLAGSVGTAFLDSREPALETLPLIGELTDATLEQARATLKTSGAARAVRLLANSLERHPSASVRGKDVSSHSKFDYQIEVEVLRFDQSATGDCQLTARWVIKGGHTQNAQVMRESQSTRAADVAAEVAGLSAALSDLGEEIAPPLHGLPKPAESGRPVRSWAAAR